ncbi:MAG: peroxiredoxin [Phycisphaerales bacterium]|nr:peroxiredoxin [Phycisphaerales bacterium]
MSLQIGDQVPDFTAETTQGTINFHEWIGDGWAVLFSHPKDFTPVCTTELGAVAGLKDEFAKRNCKIMGLSVDSVEDHAAWSHDIADATGNAVNYPMVGDTDLSIAKMFGMLPNEAAGAADERTAVDNQTVRSLFIIGPDKMIKLMLTYPMTTGRNFIEVLRVLDSIQLTANHKVATPANWNQGEDVIIVPSVSNEEAAEKYPEGWESPKPYLRVVRQPR